MGRVVSRQTFVSLRRPAGRGKSGPILVLYCPPTTGQDGRQVAFAVSKRCGGAVVRNRIRRRLRSAATELAITFPAGAYLVRTDPEAATASYEELKEFFGTAVAKATRGKKEG